MTPDLERAIERADLREMVLDLYPDCNVNPHRYKQRIKAVYRGGDNPNSVELTAKKLTDFKIGESYNVWTFLIEVAGYSKADAASYLLRLYGSGDTPRAEERAARRVASDKKQEADREAYLRRELEEAIYLQRRGPTTGTSAYLERKQVSGIFDTHEVAGATDITGAEVPGVTSGVTSTAHSCSSLCRRSPAR